MESSMCGSWQETNKDLRCNSQEGEALQAAISFGKRWIKLWFGYGGRRGFNTDSLTRSWNLNTCKTLPSEQSILQPQQLQSAAQISCSPAWKIDHTEPSTRVANQCGTKVGQACLHWFNCGYFLWSVFPQYSGQHCAQWDSVKTDKSGIDRLNSLLQACRFSVYSLA